MVKKCQWKREVRASLRVNHPVKRKRERRHSKTFEAEPVLAPAEPEPEPEELAAELRKWHEDALLAAKKLSLLQRLWRWLLTIFRGKKQ